MPSTEKYGRGLLDKGRHPTTKDDFVAVTKISSSDALEAIANLAAGFRMDEKVGLSHPFSHRRRFTPAPAGDPSLMPPPKRRRLH